MEVFRTITSIFNDRRTASGNNESSLVEVCRRITYTINGSRPPSGIRTTLLITIDESLAKDYLLTAEALNTVQVYYPSASLRINFTMLPQSTSADTKKNTFISSSRQHQLIGKTVVRPFFKTNSRLYHSSLKKQSKRFRMPSKTDV